MYRAPEMLDQWQGHNVDGTKGDIWALGCILYVLCTGTSHPFQDQPNLAILNAQYSMTETEENGFKKRPMALKDLIRAILITDPTKRPSLDKIVEYLKKIQSGDGDCEIELNEEAKKIKSKHLERQ